MSDRVFLYHDSCPKCGSKDNLARYSDGYAKCFGFGCGHYEYDGSMNSFQSVGNNNRFIKGTIQAIDSRKLREDTCKKWDYQTGIAMTKPCHIANYRDRHGNLVAQKLRFKDKSFRVVGDMSSAGLYGQWLPVATTKKLVITEGELDALSVSQAQDNKWPVVSIPNGAPGAVRSIKKELDWIEHFDEVIFFFDSDDIGRTAARDCALLLTPGKAKIAEIPAGYKDASDLLQADKPDEIIKAIWNAKPYRPDEIISVREVLPKILNPSKIKGLDYPYNCLNQFTMGLRPHELVTVAAGSGIGKSTFIREIAYSLIKSDERIGYIALEESIERTTLGLLSIHLDRPLHIGDFRDKKTIEDAFNTVFIDDRVYLYDHWGSCDSDNLVAKINFMAKGLDCRWIFLDHISIVVSGISEGDERRTIDNLMTSLRSLVQRTGIGLILVSHVKEPDGSKGHEEGAQVSLKHLRGSRSIGQLSDVVIGLERDQQGDNPNLVRVRILKNRPIGTTGICGYLEYQPETCRLIEKDDIGDLF